jgi:hypothetical protein
LKRKQHIGSPVPPFRFRKTAKPALKSLPLGSKVRGRAGSAPPPPPPSPSWRCYGGEGLAGRQRFRLPRGFHPGPRRAAVRRTKARSRAPSRKRAASGVGWGGVGGAAGPRGAVGSPGPGSAGAESVPPAAGAAPAPSPSLRAGFIVPFPRTPGDVGPLRPPRPGRVPETPLSVLAIKSQHQAESSGRGTGGSAGRGWNRPVDEDLGIPHPGDEVLSLFLGQGPLVVPEQLAGIAENQQLHPAAPTACAAGPGLLLRDAFPLRFGAAPARAVHDSVPGVRTGPLLSRATSPMPRLAYPLSQRRRIPPATSTPPP